MRKIAVLLALVVFASLSTIASYASSCSNQTLEGYYAFRVSGEVFTPGGLVYRDGVALTYFDGHHLLSQMDYVLANGVPVPGPTGPDGFHVDEGGTYWVNENCTGGAIIHFPTPPGGTSGAVVKLFFVIGDGGRELNTIVTSLTPPNSTVAMPANIHSDAVRIEGEGSSR